MRNGASQMRATLETLVLKIYDHSYWNRVVRFASIGAEQARPGLNTYFETLQGSGFAGCLRFKSDQVITSESPTILA
jgi:hypothetical protein